MNQTRYGLLAVLLCMALLVLQGCGGSDSSGVSQDMVDALQAELDDAETAQTTAEAAAAAAMAAQTMAEAARDTAVAAQTAAEAQATAAMAAQTTGRSGAPGCCDGPADCSGVRDGSQDGREGRQGRTGDR